MRTGRSLTVCCSLLPRGGFSLVPGEGGSAWSRGGSPCRGVCLVPGGLPGPGGVCLVTGGFSLVPGGGSPCWGVLLGPGGVCLVWGGVCLVPGGFSGDPSPPVNRITHTCKNITLATTSLRPVIKKKNDEPPHPSKFPKE